MTLQQIIDDAMTAARVLRNLEAHGFVASYLEGSGIVCNCNFIDFALLPPDLAFEISEAPDHRLNLRIRRIGGRHD